jgi:hypothetical protein
LDHVHPHPAGFAFLLIFLAWGARCLTTTSVHESCRRHLSIWGATATLAGVVFFLQLLLQLLFSASVLVEGSGLGALMSAIGLRSLAGSTPWLLLLVRPGPHTCACLPSARRSQACCPALARPLPPFAPAGLLLAPAEHDGGYGRDAGGAGGAGGAGQAAPPPALA